MDLIFSSVQHFCAFYLVQCSLGVLAPELSVGTCGLSLSIWPQLALHLLLGLVLLPLARFALTHRAPPPRLLLDPPPPPRPPTARPTRSRPDLFGMERYETRLLDFLEQDADDQAGTAPPAASSTSSTLGIVGARGVGKSTLLRLAYQYYCYQRFFRYVFHADAREADGGSFTADALRGVLVRDVGFWAEAGAGHVARFLRNQSFLLLLDNVQAGELGFDFLVAAGLPATLGPRQKVVFATRDESVCADMGCTNDQGNVIRMGCLGDDDAWSLFQYRVGRDVIDSSPMIKVLAKEIVRKCRGHPGALVAVGGTMSTSKQWESWSVANELLGNSSPSGAIHDESDDDQGYPCLQSFKEQFG